MTFISNLGSPLSAYTLVFPVAYYVNPLLGLTTMLCASFSEWLSGILKWLLHGHRPYWWVDIYAQQTGTPVLPIEQFPVTCETGPGSPSGHCMITMSSLVPIVLYLRNFLPKCAYPFFSTFYRDFVVSSFVFFVLLLGLSRCYLAAHFPHQVVTGTISGLILGYLFYLSLPPIKSNQGPRIEMNSRMVQCFTTWFQQILRQPWQLILLGLGSYSAAWLFSCFLQEILGMDINWSISLAQKSCKKPEWVHLSTTLMSLYIFRKFIANLFPGLGLALQMNPPWTKSISESCLSSSVILMAVVAFMATRASERICRLAVETWTSSVVHSSSDSEPSSTLLLSSVFEGSMGPLVAVWFMPYFIHLRGTTKA
ncbi:Glucose-6-phosphatase 3 [Fasciolopsis buskii]|uniref:glucose-6-phosphatase n=1 Tax=Fasciolopsis buskii TaxID=27845 RepID=A0A8E0RSR4_9TREM|nr:Glucose-6-phosphatase 3 [Fasciolopsis buski]